jgi:hypothetical protein
MSEEKSEDLEVKLEKLNWKQWLPIYGEFQAWKDLGDNKPSYRDKSRGALTYYGSIVYQAVSTSAILVGLCELGKNLF